MHMPVEIDEGWADKNGDLGLAEEAPLFRAQGVHPAQQLKHRPGQRQRLQIGHARILKQAHPHDRRPFVHPYQDGD